MKAAALPILAVVLLAGIAQCYGISLPQCNDGVLVECFVEPCAVNTCSAIPEAKCVDDYCGGCNARFYLGGEEVTKRCTAV